MILTTTVWRKLIMKNLISLLMILFFSSTLFALNNSEKIPGSDYDLGHGLRLISHRYQSVDKKNHYTINVKFPMIEGTLKSAQPFNNVVSTLVAKAVEGFQPEFNKKFITEKTKDDANYLDLDYTVVSTNQRGLLSIRFTVETYFVPEAHPAHTSFVINYNFLTGKLIQLPDLFKAHSDYLDRISNFCRQALEKREFTDTKMIIEGTKPNIDNFRNWNVTRQGLLITFNPYQVAPYVDGSPHVLILRKDLLDILIPTSQLRFIN